MNQLGSSAVGGALASGREPFEELALPSRHAALAALRRAVESPAGPVLVLGEAGSGKTWLWRRLRDERQPARRWAAVDLSPAIDPRGFYRLVGHALGLPLLDEPAGARASLADFLQESAADGTRWVLVVDEAQNLSDAVGEEVRILANGIGEPDGFAAIVLVGQTTLARRVETRPLAGLGARVSARIGLRPIDVEEARVLLERRAPACAGDLRTLERLHAECGGNPRRILQASAYLRPEPVEGRTEVGPPLAVPAPSRVAAPPPPPQPPTLPSLAVPEFDRDVPVLGPSRPPLREGDGIIEVGWEPSAEFDPGVESAPIDEELMPSTARGETTVELRPSPAAEEAVDDHYAALQAWTEWAKNQGRAPVGGPSDDPISPLAAEVPEGDPSAPARRLPLDAPASANVWAEGQHGFAPYSQLFSRLRQQRDLP